MAPEHELALVGPGPGGANAEAIRQAIRECQAGLRREGEGAGAQSQEARGPEEEALVVVSTPERDARHGVAPTECEGLHGEAAYGEGAITIGHLIGALVGVCGATLDVELGAHGCGAIEASEGRGGGRVVEWVGLDVASAARLALRPRQIASRVHHEGGACRWRAHPDPSEILPATYTDPRDHGALEIIIGII